MRRIKKIHIYDPIDLVKINNIDSAIFFEWYRPIRDEKKAQLIELFTYIQNLKIDGFLGVQEHAHFMLAVNLLYNAWRALIHRDEPYDQRVIDQYEESKRRANRLIESAEKTLDDLDKVSFFMFFSEHEKPVRQHLQGYISDLKERLKIKHSKDFYHYGLFYRNNGKKTARPGIRSVLAYRLVHTLRAYTSDNWDGIYEGQVMPIGGKPCFELVSKIINLAFPNEENLFSGELVKKTIKQMTTNSNIDIRWGDWPKLHDLKKGE